MGLTNRRDQLLGPMQQNILECVSKPGGATAGSMASMLKAKRGTVMREIGILRSKGYPIQATTMITEDGMYQALFELVQH